MTRARYIRKNAIDLEKGIHSLPDLVCELRDGDGTMAPRFVVNLNLAFERLVAQPLQRKKKFKKLFQTRLFFSGRHQP
jgi:hypothetical protein